MIHRSAIDPERAAAAAWLEAIGDLAARHRARRATEDGARSPLAHDCHVPATGVDRRPFCCLRVRASQP
jgi:hypothetical protein